MGWDVTENVDRKSRAWNVRRATAAEAQQAERKRMEAILDPVAFWCRFCRVTMDAGRHA